MYKDKLLLQKYEVIIIGAGPAGIAAALALKKCNISYIILQARNRSGGRVFTYQFSNIPIDIGACWIHAYSQQNPLYQFVQNLKIKEGKASGKDMKQIYIDEDGQIFDFNTIQKAKIKSQNLFQFSEKQGKQCQKDVSVGSITNKWYQQNINCLQHKQKRCAQFFINKTQRHEGSSIYKLSAKNFYYKLDEGRNFHPKIGYGNFLQALTLNLKIQLNKQVIQIKYNNSNVEIICKDGTHFQAQKCICSLPLGVLKSENVIFQPQLPTNYQECIEKLGIGIMNKIIVQFQQNFWGQQIYLSIAQDKRGKFAHIYNFSEQNKNILCCLVTGDFALKLKKNEDKQIINQFVKTLKRLFKKQQILVKNYIITNWDADKYSLGSYTSFHTGSSPQYCYQLRKPINQTLWFAGQHCYAEYIGTAHGAFQTGKWAAQQIIQSLQYKN